MFLKFLIILILSLGFISSMPEVSLEHQDYQPYEPIKLEINGISSKIDLTNFRIYEDRRELQIDKYSFFYNNTSYLFFSINKEGDFKLEIKNILYKEGNNLQSFNYEKNITIKKTQGKIISFSPNFFEIDKPEFDLFVFNLGNETLPIEINNEDYSLDVGETKKIILNAEEGFNYFVLDSYKQFKIPVLFEKKQVFENQTENQTAEEYKLQSKDKVSIKKLKNETTAFNYTIKNLGKNISLKDLRIETSSNLISFETPQTILSKNQETNITFYVNFSSEGFFERNISLNLENYEKIFVLEIFVFNDTIKENNFNFVETKTCSELGGTLCSSNENCQGTPFYAAGLCCTGVCVAVDSGEKKNSSQIYMGLIIIVLVAFVLFFLYKNLKKIKSPSVEDKFKSLNKN